MSERLIVLLGPTAVGKTSLAVQLASRINAEIISADSRQVYRRMDLGTGKDLEEYLVDGKEIPYHLIDILEPGETYDVFQFQKDLYASFKEITERGKQAILCGGSGLYLEAALRKEQYLEVPVNEVLRSTLKSLEMDDLKSNLMRLKKDLHNTTDLLDRDRLIRAIEIAEYEKGHTAEPSPIQDYLIFGIRMPREELRGRIAQRLEQRLKAGMIQEVEGLLKSGIKAEILDYYGLEYRYIGKYLSAELNYQEMYDHLLQAIRRFAKKQMTWFRRMEKQGHEIHWIEAKWAMNEKIEFMESKL